MFWLVKRTGECQKFFCSGRLAYKSSQIRSSRQQRFCSFRPLSKKQVTTFQILSETKTDNKANFRIGKARFFYYYIWNTYTKIIQHIKKWQVQIIYCTLDIITRSWILTIHKDRIFWKKPLWKQRNWLQKWGKKHTNLGL